METKQSDIYKGYKLLKKNPENFYPDNELTHLLIKTATDYIMGNSTDELIVEESNFLYAFEVVKFLFNESLGKKGKQQMGLNVEFT